MVPLSLGLGRGLQLAPASGGVQAAAAAVCTSAARALAAAAAPDPHGGNEGNAVVPEQGPKVVDATAQSRPRRYFQLIGDPRTGIADDTTQAISQGIQVQHIWHQETTGTNWFRYTLHGDQLPHMYMDARLSDHSRNLMYLLRAKDPKRWTIDALASKFRVRRQRVLSILALKEMEAAAIEEGARLSGPLHAYAASVRLQDLHLDPATGDPVDLAELVRTQPPPSAAAAAGGKGAAGKNAGKAAPAEAKGAAAPGLGSLADFVEGEEGEGPTALAALQAVSADSADDLSRALPAAAAAAQRLQLQLLGLMQRVGHNPAQLRAALLGEVARAESYYNTHVAGTPLEAALLAASAPAPAPTAVAASDAAGGADGGDGAAEEAEGEGGAAGAGKPLWLDWEAQRQHVEAVVDALTPLMVVAGDPTEAAARRLAAQLQAVLEAPAPAAEAAAAEPAEGSSDSSSGSSSQGQQQAEALVALVEGAAAGAFADAFRALPQPLRRQLLAAAAVAKARLNEAGVDINAALAEEQGAQQHGQQQQAVSNLALPQAPRWPGQVPPLVDVWGFQELPAGQLAALVEAAGMVEAALQALAASAPVTAAAAAGPGGAAASAAAPITASVSDVSALQETLETYNQLGRIYDLVLDEQAAAAAGTGGGGAFAAPPPLPPAQQRRMLQVLRQLDPNAVEKLMYWESVGKEDAAGNKQRARKLRENVNKVIEAMDEQARGGAPPEFPALPRPKSSKADPVDQRYSPDVAAAHLEANVVGKVYHRGSGERHTVHLDTYPSFEGCSLQEFDGLREGELSALSRVAAAREDELQWREFRERLLYNLGLAGADLWVTHGHSKPQKPEEGWSYVFHHLGSRAARRAGALPASFVSQPGGSTRDLVDDEAFLVRRRTAKARPRWFYKHKRPRSLNR